MAFFEKQLSSDVKFTGRIVTVRVDDVELQNGAKVKREVVEHPGGVAIVPLEEGGDVLCVRQYRYPLSKELLEIPAGKLEYGEEPLACAIRELSEETGCTAAEMIPLGKIYPSPGYCKETLYLYLARGLGHGAMHLDENEFLNVERWPLDQLIQKVMNDEISDAKTVVGLLKTKVYLAK